MSTWRNSFTEWCRSFAPDMKFEGYGWVPEHFHALKKGYRAGWRGREPDGIGPPIPREIKALPEWWAWLPGMLVSIDRQRTTRVCGSLQDQARAWTDDDGRIACHDGDVADWVEPCRLWPVLSCHGTRAIASARQQRWEVYGSGVDEATSPI